MVKEPPAMRETWVRTLGWKDPLEKGMATHSSVLAWRIPWMEEPGGLQSMGSQGATNALTFTWTVACQAPLSMGFSRQEYAGMNTQVFKKLHTIL